MRFNLSCRAADLVPRLRGARLRGAGVLGAGLLLAGLLAAHPAGAAAPPPMPTAGASLGQLPQQWRDDRGQPVSLTALANRPVVLTMAYATCHKLCPATISNLQSLQKSLDQRGVAADIVIVGYDPENDDPASWHEYRLHRRLLRSNWHFLTGTIAATEQLAHQLGFEFWKYDDHVMHDVRVVVFDQHGNETAVHGSDTRDWTAIL